MMKTSFFLLFYFSKSIFVTFLYNFWIFDIFASNQNIFPRRRKTVNHNLRSSVPNLLTSHWNLKNKNNRAAFWETFICFQVNLKKHFEHLLWKTFLQYSNIPPS